MKRLTRRLTPTKLPTKRPSFWFIGPWAHASGLGEAARGALRTLWSMSAELEVEAEAMHNHGMHERIGPHATCTASANQSEPTVSWLHCNPDAASMALTPAQKKRLQSSRHVVATWVWESQQLPVSWHQALSWIDQLWVPSTYVRDLIQPYTNKPIHVVPHLVELPSRSAKTVKRERQVLYIFDGHSYLHRKNPHHLLEAFATSDLPAKGWKLVLKTKNLSEAGGEPALLSQFHQRLQDLQKRWPEQIQLLDVALDRQAITGLLNRSAIYASPHASEGFGLTIAEAMAHGCLTVATDHGGCRDWLTQKTGYPINYELTSIINGYGTYPAGSVWANVKPEPLAQGLNQAAEVHDTEPDHAADIRMAAFAAIENSCGEKAVASAIRHALSSVL